MQDYEDKMRDMEGELERSNNKPPPSLFKLMRTVCLSCGKCAVYKGNFGEFSINSKLG